MQLISLPHSFTRDFKNQARHALRVTLILLFLFLAPQLFAQTIYNVKNYGATGNGSTNDTPAIQSAVDAAFSGGGGLVTFPPGTYAMGGGINLSNNVTVILTNGVSLMALTNQSDWGGPAPDHIFYGYSVNDIGIQGANGYGLMDGGGLFFYQGDPGNPVSGNHLTHMLEFHYCNDVTLANLHLQNSCEQTITFNDCSNISVVSVTVTNRPREFGSGDDGIDFSDDAYVLVTNMNVNTGDDGICVKTETNDPVAAHDIWIGDSTVASTCMSTKFGTATFGEAYNVVFSNITVNLKSGIVKGTNNPLPDGRTEAAINVCMCNGGFNHDIVFTHYTINECSIPIYMEVNDRTGNGFGISSNIFLGDINCLNASNACQFNIESGATDNLKNIIISNLVVTNYETYSGTNSPPYQDNGYPYGYQIGSTIVHMPAYGLFARYVNGLTFAGNNQYYDAGHSGRPNAVILENCSNVVTNSNPDFTITASPSSQSLIPGLTTNYTVTISAENGFNGTVNLASSGLPTGTSGAFNPTSVTGSGTSIFTVTTTTNLTGGTYTLTLTGTNGSLIHSTTVSLVVADFTVALSPTSQTVAAGGTTNYTVDAGNINAFTGTINLSATNLPAGATASFSPASLTAPGLSTLMISTLTSTPTGTNTFMVTGASGNLIRSTSGTLIVTPPPSPDFGLATSPGSETITAGNSTTYTNTVGAINGFSGTVNFSASGLPAGTTPSFNPASVTTSGTSVLTVTTTTNVAAGTYNVTIIGTGPTTVHSNIVTLVINSAGGNGLPSGWVDVDIGSPPLAGSATVTNGIWTVKGSGTDIWNASDVFNYANESLSSSSATGIVQLVSQTATGNAKSGIMFRETTNAASIEVMLVIQASSSKGLTFACRSSTGGSTVAVVGDDGAIQPPQWLRLVRNGSTFSAAYSSDGVSWTAFGSTNVTMLTNALVGLAVTSAGTNLNTATFTNINFPSSIPPSPDFSLSMLPPSETVTAGNATTYTNTISALNGFTGTVSFAVGGLPAGATPSFSPTTVTTSGTSMLTVTTTTNVTAGTYTLTNTATSGTLVHTTTFTLVVNAPSSGLLDVDLGTPPAAGSSSVSNGTWTVKGSGADIWNTSDVGNYAYENIFNTSATGTVYVASQSSTNSNAKASIMFRETTNATSIDVLLCIQHSSSKGLTFACRSTTGGSTVGIVANNSSINTPYWLRLVRANNTFTAYSSSNGTSWTKFGSTNVTMATSATFGLAVTSASTNAVLNTATYSNLTDP